MALSLQKLNQIEAMLPAKFPNMSAQEKAAVSSLLMQKKAELLQSSGVNIKDIPTDPLQRQVFEQQVSSGNYQAPGNGMQDLQDVVTQGGSDFINKGKTKDERLAIAQEIMKAGGINKYRQILPLKDLADEKELTGLTASTDLKGKIDTSLPDFQENTAGGTGPLAQFIPDFLRRAKGRDKVAGATLVQSLYQQMISGKVISEQEAKRLEKFLPTKWKTETNNRQDLQRLKDGIDLNLKLFEKGKREGLTANEAYDKYGKDIIQGQKDAKKPKTTDVKSYVDKYFK